MSYKVDRLGYDTKIDIDACILLHLLHLLHSLNRSEIGLLVGDRHNNTCIYCDCGSFGLWPSGPLLLVLAFPVLHQTTSILLLTYLRYLVPRERLLEY